METLRSYHFFDDKLNLYGDRGNVIALQKRAEWRGVALEIIPIRDVTGISLTEADLMFIGGGPDSLQSLCTEQLFTIREEFKAAIEDGVSTLTICGGYQFLGNYYQLPSGEQLKGLGLLDFHTISPSTDARTRLIGNILIESEKFGRIVGFENHGGRTYHSYDTLGLVVKGHGNNGEDNQEGLVYKHLIGTYLHGPILPKNHKITDFLLENAYQRKFGKTMPSWEKNEREIAANQQVWAKFS